MKAVLVFVEGRHDRVFVVRSLGAAGASWVNGPINALPAPFGSRNGNPKSVIVTHFQQRTLGDLKLQHAAHAPLPSFEAMVQDGDCLFVVLRMGSDSDAAAAMKLFQDVRDQVEFFKNSPSPLEIDAVAAAFVFDADDDVALRKARFTADHDAILPDDPRIEHATWTPGPHGPVGLFIFHDPNTGTGTVEDTLAPMAQQQWPGRWEAANTYLSAHAQPGDPVKKKPAECLKARITITGQFLYPGAPMSRIIDRNGLNANHFQGPVSRALVDFLRAAPW